MLSSGSSSGRFNTLKVGHVNVNSLANKVDFIADLLLKQSIHVLAVSETWLLPAVASSFVDIADYSVVRGDTNGAARKHGSLLYMHNNIAFLVFEVHIPNVVAVHLIDYDLWIIAVYRPPSYTILENTFLLNFLLNFCPGKEVIIAGDFNLPTIDWSLDLIDGYIRPVDTQFLDCFSSLGLLQWVKEPTFLLSDNILDLLLTSEEDRVGGVFVLPPLPCCQHSPVVFEYIFSGEGPERLAVGERRAWRKGKYAKISEALSQIDWGLEFSYSSVNEDFSYLQSVLLSLIDKFIPLMPVRSGPPWAVRVPPALTQLRSEAWHVYKQVRRAEGRNSAGALERLHIYKELNWNYRHFSVDSRKKYESDLLNRPDSRKLFHAYVRKKKIGRPAVGPLRLRGGEIIQDPARMCEVFAAAFSGVFVSTAPTHPAPFQAFAGSLADVDVSRLGVQRVLLALDPSSSMGPDGLHPYLLRSCAAELALPLCLIYQKSLRTGAVPEVWGESLVVPIFKAKSHTDPLNYRPVSLTSVCCKAMERIVVSQLTEYLESNNILSPHQYGFRKNRSTEDQLLLTYDDVGRWTDEGYVVDVILLDFSKAFDVVSHAVLLSKLESLGVCNPLLAWICAFLSGRVMSVCVGSSMSSPVDVTSGVPQGSVLGPLLFLIYINHISSGLSCRFKAFADDYKLYLRYPRRGTEPADQGVQSLQSGLDTVDSVAKSWNLGLNPDKCVVLRFHRGRIDFDALVPVNQYFLQGRALKLVTAHKDLGVSVDTSLRFHHHIRVVAAKAGGLANCLLRSTICRSREFMLSLYVSHIRPLIEYASCVWNTGYCGDCRLLESVQRRWTKRIDGLSGVDYGGRLRSLDLFSVKGRLLRADLIKYWKILHGKSGDLLTMFSLAPRVGTRGHALKLVVPPRSSDVRSRSFSVRRVGVWNGLPADVVQLTDVAHYKQALADLMYDEFLDFD